MPSPFFNQSGSGGGSSSGQGGINYISNFGFEDNTSGWATYADAAQATPVDGTGGSPTCTLTRTTVAANVLRGSAAGLYSKPASNEQGEGFSYDLTLNVQDFDGSKPLYVSFDYMTGANYVNNDYRVFVYDKDAATLLNVLSLTGDGSIASAPDPSRFVGVFYSTSGNNDYRLIIHNTSTNALAHDFVIDNVSVSPQGTVPGFIGGGPVAFTPTGSWSANTTYSGFYTRFGKWAFYDIKIAMSGAPTATGLNINLPLTTDSSVQTIGSGGAAAQILSCDAAVNPGSATYPVSIYLNSATQISVFTNNVSTYVAASAQVSNTVPATFGAGGVGYFRFWLPISGWEASAALSTTETMVRATTFRGNASATVNNTTPTITLTETWDPLNAYSGSTFTAPVTGKYKLGGYVRSGSATWVAGNAIEVYYSKNGGSNIIIGRTNPPAYTGIAQAMISDSVELNAGNTLVFKAYADQSSTSDINITVDLQPDFSIFSVYGQTEYQESINSTAGTNWPFAAGFWGDLTSLTLQPGEYDLTAITETVNNGAVTTGNVAIGISTTSGNSGTGLSTGVNRAIITNVGTTAYQYTLTVPSYRVVVTTPTTYYLKGICVNAVTNFQHTGYRLSARRVK